LLLLVIVLMSGTEAHLNPNEIVAILEARDADDPTKRYTKEVRCVIQMSNGEEFTTKEECASIEKRLHELKGN
jgi:hypothetical protein